MNKHSYSVKITRSKLGVIRYHFMFSYRQMAWRVAAELLDMLDSPTVKEGYSVDLDGATIVVSRCSTTPEANRAAAKFIKHFVADAAAWIQDNHC